MQQDEFSQLYNRALPGTLRYYSKRIRKMNLDDDFEKQAEDLAQDAFLKTLILWRLEKNKKHKISSIFWFVSISVMYKFIQDTKKKGLIDNSLAEKLLSDDKDGCQSLITKQKVEAIKSRLKPETLLALDLLNEGYKYKEIRKLLNKSPTALSMIFSRIK